MKGPGLRLNLDVRRLWRCPGCGAERRTGGERTTVVCHQCSNARLMHLIDRERPPRHVPPPLDLVIAYEPEDLPAEEHSPLAAEIIDTFEAVARLDVIETELIDVEVIEVEVVESLVHNLPLSDVDSQTDDESIEPENLTEPSLPGDVTDMVPEPGPSPASSTHPPSGRKKKRNRRSRHRRGKQSQSVRGEASGPSPPPSS